ncbi:hypothetical protein [Haliangium sp.]|uniref:hypothetical protein n=1 Tax=Haliangium sp. TaxID=2663208 RepID=UPI003D0E443F
MKVRRRYLKYAILKGALIAGVVFGFGTGFAHLGQHWAEHRAERHDAWSQQWAQTCAEAALAARAEVDQAEAAPTTATAPALADRSASISIEAASPGWSAAPTWTPPSIPSLPAPAAIGD